MASNADQIRHRSAKEVEEFKDAGSIRVKAPPGWSLIHLEEDPGYHKHMVLIRVWGTTEFAISIVRPSKGNLGWVTTQDPKSTTVEVAVMAGPVQEDPGRHALSVTRLPLPDHHWGDCQGLHTREECSYPWGSYLVVSYVEEDEECQALVNAIANQLARSR